jgi:hypothetical protein
MNISYLEQLKKKPIPKTKKEFIVNANIIKTKKDIEEEEQEPKLENEENEKEEKEEKEEPLEKESKPINKIGVKIVDKRNESKIDRELILKRLKNQMVVKPDNIIEEPEPTQLKEVEPEPAVEPKAKIVKKRKIKIITDVNVPDINVQPDMNIGEQVETIKIKKPKAKPKNVSTMPIKDVVIGNIKLGDRLPKPSEKVIYKASSYYMNNRKISIEKLNKLFHPYRKEILDNQETVSCESRSNAIDFDLLTHQKIVRDYLNLYTPYRGLLLFHGLGSGKTCTSIAIAEGMKTDKKVILMTPASLKMNFFSELKKCGDHLFRKNQFWEFVSIFGQPDLINVLSSALSLPKDFIEKNHGAWLVDVNKPSNFTELTTNNQKVIDEQLNEMIRSKYVDLNYNGLNMNKLREFTKEFTINPFDNSVVIVDEAHNFVSRIVNKIKKTKSISYILYDYLLKASNARVVLLTGTPIINYPNEIGILYNILRGYIKTWTFPVNVQTSQKINRDTILSIFDKENFKTHDYVEYSGNKLTVTRNPFGFVNTKKRASHKGGSKQDESVISIDTSKLLHAEPEQDKYSEDFNKDLLQQSNGITVPGLDESSVVFGGNSDNEFDKYNGVKLDDSGNISDNDFTKTIIAILSKHKIEVAQSAIKITYNKALPDDSESFLNTFVDQDSVVIKNENLFKRRILGLTSYFRSAQEKLLPTFVKTDDGNIIHIVASEMSDYQFSVYEKIRKEEHENEKKAKRNSKKQTEKEDMYQMSSTYRIFSRACCNYAFPSPPGRPMPDKKGEKDISETDIDAVNADLLQDVDEYADIDDAEEMKNDENIQVDYQKRIQLALQYLKDHATDCLLPDGLKQYSPKFLEVLSNLQDSENIGLHLIYTQFRTIEGIGILKLLLEANGFSEFKIQKKSGGDWEILDFNDKPKFLLYTGTESAEEKEILRNIYNSQWEFVPSSISQQLQKIADNNYIGEIVKIMMITSSGSEGINLRNTRFVHIIEPYWHMVRVDQVIGRARRICSHQDLPEELRTVKVFLYLSTLSEEQSSGDKNKELVIRDVSRIDGKTPLTTDETLYEISRIKDNINQQLLTAVKESAMDCSLYSGSENLVCYGYGKVESNQFGSFPTLEEDVHQKEEINIEKQKLKLVKITVDSVDYALDRNTGIVYDMASYLRSKKTGENLITIGKLVKQGRKNVIDTRQLV